MDAREQLLSKLIKSLEELTKFHRQLLELVRQEREILLGAQLAELEAHNERKDLLIMKIRMADEQRLKIAQETAAAVGADPKSPRLLEIARRLSGANADRLRSLHSTLETLLTRIAELNRDNEDYVRSALRTLNGAMNNVKETLSGKPTYQRKGTYRTGPETSGHFVSKEA